MTTHPSWTHVVFSDADLDSIAEAIAEAERATSAEIRVHLERRMPRRRQGSVPDPLDRAREIFAILGLHRTAERNAVLIFLALEDRGLAIVGDEEVHRRVGSEYWEHLRDVMVDRFRAHAPREGVLAAVADVGGILRRFFPQSPDDTNELSDEVTRT